ncbi:MAG TPA: prenyltransferase/squalene oxidase repeat-containing protein, partial [Planctomycetota bacterium]|nr:prenyltransferase/squalene oxidase repeat-containing protein [Planctomycetota bacterium]
MAREAFEGACGPAGVAEPGAGESREKLEWLRSTPSWALSAGLHLVLVLVLLTVVTDVKRPAPPPEGPIGISVREPDPLFAPEPPRYDPEAERGTEKVLPPPVLLPRDDLPTFTPTLEEEPVLVENEKGISPTQTGDRHHDFSDMEVLGKNIAIGTGVDIMGDRGTPDGTGHARGPLNRPPPPSEDAVRAALEWLRKHQSDDGSWKSRDFVEKCKRPCRNGSAGPLDPAGRGFQEHDVGVTALAVLAFTGWGHTHQAGTHPEYMECVRKAVRYLLRVQARSVDPAVNGRIGSGEGEQWIYGHAIATMALSEVLLLSRDVILLKRPVTDAVKLCLLARNDGLAWRYGIKPGDNDTSVTGWMVLALKTAKVAKLDIPPEEFDQALGGALAWIHRVTNANGKAGYFVPGDEGSRLSGIHPEPYPFSKELSSMTAVSVLCRLFAG